MKLFETYTDPGNSVLRLFLKHMGHARGRGFMLKKVMQINPGWNKAKLVFENCSLSLDLTKNSDIGYFYGHGLGNEKFFKEVLIRLVDPDSVFYDIGSNLGFYSFLLSSHVKQCFAFELNPDLVKRIQQVIQTNSLRNVEVIEKGLSDKEMELVFYMQLSSHGNSSFIKPNIESKEIKVKSSSLDQIMREKSMPAPTLMKIDTEGNELDILSGYTGLLIEKPIILMEWLFGINDEIKNEYLAHLLQGHYDIYKIGDSPEIISWDNKKPIVFNNILLMPKDSDKINRLRIWLNRSFSKS